MRLYYARFPFEIDSENGTSDYYSPTLAGLKRFIKDTVRESATEAPETFKYCCKPLGKPDADGLVPVEISVDLERIDGARLTVGLFCSAVNNAGNAGFVRRRIPLDPMFFKLRVSGEIFE